jgi:hypothetical protein
LGVWYELEKLGPGYSISIPEAYFQDTKGGMYEGVGVEPDRLLHYEISDLVLGKDSWLQRLR